MGNLQSQQEHTDRRDGFRVRSAMPILLEAVDSSNGYSGPFNATVTSLGPAGISLTALKDLPVGLVLDARLASP